MILITLNYVNQNFSISLFFIKAVLMPDLFPIPNVNRMLNSIVALVVISVMVRTREERMHQLPQKQPNLLRADVVEISEVVYCKISFMINT